MTEMSPTFPQKNRKPRTCVGCGEESPKKALLRIVRNDDGTLSYDPSGRAQGRGAYLCSDITCINNAKKKKALQRSLKVQSEGDIYEKLILALEKVNNDESIK
ncbi:MAG: YlxR family protein [Synergistaceae bacterium]